METKSENKNENCGAIALTWTRKPAIYDLDPIKACAPDLFKQYPECLWIDLLQSNADTSLLLLKGLKIIGYVIASPSMILFLAINIHERRKGHARHLLHTLLHENRYMGPKVTLQVRTQNEVATCLYEKLGFVKTGSLPKYYINPDDDAFVYEINLTVNTKQK